MNVWYFEIWYFELDPPLIALSAIPGPIFLCAAANRGFLFLFNETLGHDDVIANTTQVQSYCFVATPPPGQA